MSNHFIRLQSLIDLLTLSRESYEPFRTVGNMHPSMIILNKGRGTSGSSIHLYPHQGNNSWRLDKIADKC